MVRRGAGRRRARQPIPRRGAARDGLAVLVVSSHLPELLGLCDRIAVMRRGVLGEFRDTDSWTQEDLLHEAMFGEPVGGGVT